ncbi:methyl-accepting chemotaxis protein [Roseomonas sp. NAR14]|uniref:Methyl-accepting chemotaxis protein n=1 Tax=Roseomonas acroporae TaxID=2937791 RepID=A0A9X1Y4T8_9PROT|nr:methyl-accepting chemotaxis protein [Roseomonas acroporae]MCK8784219.1 methyl-accepting chemotaxis protein [Roseomonas acroporae]
MLTRSVTPDGMGALGTLRRDAERALVGIILLHGPLLGVAAWLAGGSVWRPLSLWLGIAVAAGGAHVARPAAPATRALVAVALCLMPALLVEAFSRHPWQADAHMHFFAALAVTAALLDRNAVLVAATAIALHHLVLNFLLPAAVFPGGGDLARVVFHAVIVVFETAALCWLIDRAAHALTAAEAAAAEVARQASERERERALAESRAVTGRREAAAALAAEIDRSLTEVANGLATSSNGMKRATDDLSASATETTRQADDAARNIQEASMGVQTVAAATEEMTTTIREITSRVREAAAAAGSAVTEIRATDAVVQALSEGASRISDVVRLIGTIAAQTNLLALNATIEAARAGEQGKGFAVVAGEVKALANQTAAATEEIGAQVAQMQEATARAVAAIRAIGVTVEQTSEIAGAIASAVEEQDHATREISCAAQDVAVGTERVATGVARASQAVGETSEALDALRLSSGEIARQGELLRAEVTRLTQELRRQGEAA